MAQKPINVFVWKPYGPLEEAEAALSKIQRSKLFQEDRLYFALPIGYLSQRQWPKSASDVSYGAYEMPSMVPGAFTEKVAPQILESCKAAFVLLGTAAVRARPELAALIPAQMTAASSVGLTSLVCLGESEEEHQAGRGGETVREQLAQLKGHLPSSDKIIFVYEAPWLHETLHLTELPDLKKAYQNCREALVAAVPQAKLLCAVPDELFDFDAFRTAIDADGYYFPNTHMHVGCLASADLLIREAPPSHEENVEIAPPSFEAVAETGEAAKLLEDAVLTAAHEETGEEQEEATPEESTEESTEEDEK